MREQDIEMQIWDYLDQQCTEEEKKHIAILIEKDVLWRQKYTELQVLHLTLNAQEPEHPSLRFVQNVMDVVSQEHIAPSAKAYLNKWIIRGIATFFLAVITTLLVTVLDNSGSPTGSDMIRFSVPKFVLPDFSLNALSYGFLLLNIIAALVLIDTLLRRKRNHKTAL